MENHHEIGALLTLPGTAFKSARAYGFCHPTNEQALGSLWRELASVSETEGGRLWAITSSASEQPPDTTVIPRTPYRISPATAYS